jgi:hypothetical protein
VGGIKKPSIEALVAINHHETSHLCD